jgi:antirestriction protein
MAIVKVTDEPKLYVGTYAKYNAGSIEGKWLTLSDYDDKEAFLKACAELHKDEADPELMYQDFEYLPRELYNESHLDDRIWEYLEYDEDDREKIADYLDEVDSSADMDDALNAYQGNIDDMRGDHLLFASKEEVYGHHVVEEGLFGEEIPESLQNYIDYEALGRDWLMDVTITDRNNIFGSN